MTQDRSGRSTPKQYARLTGPKTLLESTLERAARITVAERVVAIVAAHHKRWWEHQLTAIPPSNVVVQPENRGTAAGILLPLLWIARFDRQAAVVVLPSDHFVSSEATLTRSVNDAIDAVREAGTAIILLGMQPEGPEDGYGWIVPCDGCEDCPYRVSCFLEKPTPETAATLHRRGAFLNSFIMVGDLQRLLSLFRREAPLLWRSFEQLARRPDGFTWHERRLAEIYRSVPNLDFSKHVLEAAADTLRVYPVPRCGWTDLGTPERLARHLVHHRSPDAASIVGKAHGSW
jgi:mannose-1-phosphate guanylyltransferase